jgi:hypothetical protein
MQEELGKHTDIGREEQSPAKMTHSCLEFYHNRTKYFYAGSKKREQLLRF